ncbi:hypothetical protein SCHAM137S_05863 [Streptomyces chartreusis]
MTVTTGGPRTEAAEQPRREGVAPAGGSPGPRLRGGTQPNGPGQPLRARTVAVRAALRRRHRVTVPARLRLLRTATVLLATASAALLLVAGITALGTWDTVADRDAPRTTSAAGLALALNDMDAQAANILLSSGDAGRGRLGTPYRKAVGLYGDARRGIGHELRTLAVAAQGNPADEKTVESLTDGFAEYQELVGRALENDGRKGGKPDALDDHREATDLLQHRLLPEARTLVSSNDDAFEAHYNAARTTLTVQFTAVVALGVLLLAVLGFLQWYLARRFRRILNPGVLAATACALLAVILGGQMLSASSDQLRGARRDAFDSVVALSRARAIAYDANADESRYLLDPGRRDQYERAFLAKSQELYGIEGATLSSYDAGLATSWRAYRSDNADLRFTGEFRRELDNITFAGERAAAERSVEAYTVYQRDDRTIRALVAQGKERAAVEFCISWEAGMSNAHFGAWMAALDQVTDINREHFAGSVREGRSAVSGQLPWVCGLLLAAALLTVLGLRPRLAEFR